MKDIWDREISVDTEIWRNRTGNTFTGKEPRGRGDWAFHFGGYTYGETPSTDYIVSNQPYSIARKQAIAECAKRGRNLVVVLATA